MLLITDRQINTGERARQGKQYTYVESRGVAWRGVACTINQEVELKWIVDNSVLTIKLINWYKTKRDDTAFEQLQTDKVLALSESQPLTQLKDFVFRSPALTGWSTSRFTTSLPYHLNIVLLFRQLSIGTLELGIQWPNICKLRLLKEHTDQYAMLSKLRLQRKNSSGERKK